SAREGNATPSPYAQTDAGGDRLSNARWRKASRSTGNRGECVEVAGLIGRNRFWPEPLPAEVEEAQGAVRMAALP
ncbi:MAG: hypothetical protein QOE54_3003, partial [Streptosporangiaceae bacterium]|nr:hypothetical protein [Streptosporangiaceae bacterium]